MHTPSQQTVRMPLVIRNQMHLCIPAYWLYYPLQCDPPESTLHHCQQCTAPHHGTKSCCTLAVCRPTCLLKSEPPRSTQSIIANSAQPRIMKQKRCCTLAVCRPSFPLKSEPPQSTQSINANSAHPCIRKLLHRTDHQAWFSGKSMPAPLTGLPQSVHSRPVQM